MTRPASPFSGSDEHPASPLIQLPNTYRAFFGGFPHLHPAQRQVIGPILEGRDLVLQSATGSGKTEAVLAPCTERVIQSGRVKAILYLVPTRALAIDLERRLAPVLAERLGLRLGIRTGDLKRSGGDRPDLMLTTPESLDVLLGSANPDWQRFTQRVRMVIIDEVHPLLHQYRGKQLAYLLKRLERRVGERVQKVALSATIADVDSIITFFGFRPDAARVISSVQRDIVPHLVHLKKMDAELPALLNDLYRTWEYRKILMFANSRGQCDRLFNLASRQGSFRDVAELHYSNLKPRERRAVEERFRRRDHALCVSTSTLELGIDVGDVDGVILFEPPDSVSSFLQRIGRSNRRGNRTRFWGICRGERAGEQLLRFLGLLRLARQGVVEMPPAHELPSVLVQQVLSCLYEKKIVSLASMQDLFPKSRKALERIFPAMEKQGWLRMDRSATGPENQAASKAGPPRDALRRGGWRYREALLERAVWSNFPETEEDYSLIISGEAVADLPRSIVRQLEPGDCVHLAGKRIQILEINDTGERKWVSAEPTDLTDLKELLWLGTGFQVSFEVVQAMRSVIALSEEEVDTAGQGLFARTRRLLREEMEAARRAATLGNGIEALRDATGVYRYRTFLGSMGNLILRFTIERSLQGGGEELYVNSDEIGITSSHRIDFKRLPLPQSREDLRRWAGEHLRALRVLLPLNAFAGALPGELLIEEVTGFLYDPRVIDHFAIYRSRSSDIVSGNPLALELPAQELKAEGALFLQPAACASLLALEKERWSLATDSLAFRLDADARHVPRALTGTLIGEYMRHHQCERRLSFHFLPPDQRPYALEAEEAARHVDRTERGRNHEKQVLDRMRGMGVALHTIEEVSSRGEPRSLQERFRETLDFIRRTANGISSEEDIYCSQGVLIASSLLAGSVFDKRDTRQEDGDDPNHSLIRAIDAIGIPDLLRISCRDGVCFIEVGDIKDSTAPHCSQKWQVAFYAWLLEACARSEPWPDNVKLSRTGFLILRGRQSKEEPEPAIHSFELDPFFAAFPALLANIRNVLLKSPTQALCHLKEHCTTCPYFDYCYGQALREEEVQFLPRLSQGALWKLRRLGLSRLDEAERWLDATASRNEQQAQGIQDPFSPHQREELLSRVKALQTNRIALRSSKARIPPLHGSTALFVHQAKDPATGLPRLLGFRAVEETDALVDAAFWALSEEDDPAVAWSVFVDRFMAAWTSSIRRGRRPHLFYFGPKVRQGLQEWELLAGQTDRLSFLWKRGGAHSTDLRALLEHHFNFPAPGALTLAALARILGWAELSRSPDPARNDLIPVPQSLFHDDPDPNTEQGAGGEGESLRHVQYRLMLEEKLLRWAHQHLESAVEQVPWDDIREDKDSPAAAYLHFLEEERRLREEDILALQEYSLEERIDRFRALGPLAFTDTSLDEEGRFLYNFRATSGSTLSKFREEDFLKLVPVGSHDLQGGLPVILARYDPGDDRISVRFRQGRPVLSTRLAYSLEEDLTDWNHPKLVHAVQTVLDPAKDHPVTRLLSGRWSMDNDPEKRSWARQRLPALGSASGLNAMQRAALELPFRKRLALIEGPPGTGKTHLLGWIIIALVLQAQECGAPLRIAVSALTHQAIDGVLQKVVDLVNRHYGPDFPAPVFKWGRRQAEGKERGKDSGAGKGTLQVQALENWEEPRHLRHLVLGSTGFGLYSLFEGHTGGFPQLFDWVIFDEASQLLAPQAILSLVYGKGQFLFLGDVKQLPPVVMGRYGEALADEVTLFPGAEQGSSPVATPVYEPGQSVLAHLLDRYGAEHRVRLDESYRMNEKLCAFPSRMWYDGALHAAPGNARARLELHIGSSRLEPAQEESRYRDWLDRVLDPEKPVVLVIADHEGCSQQSELEVKIVAELAHRLMNAYGLGPDRMALISPHRAQNNAMASKLRALAGGMNSALPVVDTVERMQGAERDVILFSLTTSDIDQVMGEFINNPNRFNVAITRARHKLIVVGSHTFFQSVAQNEEALRANRCFKEFLKFCRDRDALFVWPGEFSAHEEGAPP